MAVAGGPTCARCGGPLRWIAEWNAWGCDRCQVTYPAQPQAAAPPQPAYAQPPPPARAPKQPGSKKALLIGGGVAVVAVVAVVLVLTLGGKHGGKGSPDALLQAAVDDAAKGDVDGLLGLEVGNDFTSYVDCKDGKQAQKAADEMIKEARRDLEKDLDGWKGVKVTVGKVEEKGEPHVEKADKGDGGDGYGCRSKYDVTEQKFTAEVTVRGPKDDKDQKTSLTFRALKIDGTWYLEDLPDPPSGDVGQLKELRDKMCACKDAACADAAQKDLEELGKTLGAKYKDTKPSEEMMKLVEEMSECEMKARSSP